MGADLIEFAAPETAEVTSEGKSFGSAAKSVGSQTLRKQLGSGCRQKIAFQQMSSNNPVCHVETFSHTVHVISVKQFSVPTFSDSFWKRWR